MEPLPAFNSPQHAYHEEGLGSAVDAQEEHIDAVQAEHANGDGRGERRSAVQEEERRSEGVPEGDDKRPELREKEQRSIHSTDSGGEGDKRWMPVGPASGSSRAWRPVDETKDLVVPERRRDMLLPPAVGRGSEQRESRDC